MRHVSLKMSDDAHDVLTDFSDANNVSKGEALRRAIGLLALAQEQRREGKCLAIAKEGKDKELHVLGRITGV